MPNKISGYDGNKPDVAWWMEQIRYAYIWRKERSYEEMWETWVKYYRGQWAPNVFAHNLFFRVLRTMVPRTYFRNPSVSVISRKAGIENFILSQLMEITDNRLIKDMNLKHEMKRLVHSSWLRGTGIGKIGIGSQFEVDPTVDNVPNPESYKNLKNNMEYDKRLMDGIPWFRNIHPSQYLVPYGTIDKNEARWDCFIFRRPTADVIADSRFKVPKDLQPSAMEMFTEYKGSDLDNEDKQIPMTDIYEIRDKKTDKVFLITPGYDKPLLFEDDVYNELKVDPTSVLIFNEDDEGFWGVPDAQILDPMQKEANDIRTYMAYHRRLSIIKILARKGAVDKEEVRKILDGDVGSIVWTNEDIRESVAHFQGATIPQELFKMDDVIEGDVRDMLGQSQNQAGEFKQGSRSPSATEVQEVSEAANIRTDERRDMIADLVTKVINDINPIIFNNWDEDLVEKIIGADGVPIWVAFKPEMLKRGQYEFRVDPDTAVPETRNLREAKALRVYEILKTNPLIDPVELTRYLLHEMYGVSFDGMMRGLPQGAGLTPDKPVNVGQLQQITQQQLQ